MITAMKKITDCVKSCNRPMDVKRKEGGFLPRFQIFFYKILNDIWRLPAFKRYHAQLTIGGSDLTGENFIIERTIVSIN